MLASLVAVALHARLSEPMLRMVLYPTDDIEKNNPQGVVFFYGAAGRSRTDTVSLPPDFEQSKTVLQFDVAQRRCIAGC